MATRQRVPGTDSEDNTNGCASPRQPGPALNGVGDRRADGGLLQRGGCRGGDAAGLDLNERLRDVAARDVQRDAGPGQLLQPDADRRNPRRHPQLGGGHVECLRQRHDHQLHRPGLDQRVAVLPGRDPGSTGVSDASGNAWDLVASGQVDKYYLLKAGDSVAVTYNEPVTVGGSYSFTLSEGSASTTINNGNSHVAGGNGTSTITYDLTSTPSGNVAADGPIASGTNGVTAAIVGSGDTLTAVLPVTVTATGPT